MELLNFHRDLYFKKCYKKTEKSTEENPALHELKVSNLYSFKYYAEKSQNVKIMSKGNSSCKVPCLHLFSICH